MVRTHIRLTNPGREQRYLQKRVKKMTVTQLSTFHRKIVNVSRRKMQLRPCQLVLSKWACR